MISSNVLRRRLLGLLEQQRKLSNQKPMKLRPHKNRNLEQNKINKEKLKGYDRLKKVCFFSLTATALTAMYFMIGEGETPSYDVNMVKREAERMERFNRTYDTKIAAKTPSSHTYNRDSSF